MRQPLAALGLGLILSFGGGSMALAQAGADPAASGGSTGFDDWGLLGLLGLIGLFGGVRSRAEGVRERYRIRKEAKHGLPETAFAKLRADEARRVAADAELRKAARPWAPEAQPQGPAYPAWSTASNPTGERPLASATVAAEERQHVPSGPNGSGKRSS